MNGMRVAIGPIGFCLAIYSMPVLAEDWKPILRVANDTTQVYVDVDSAIRRGESIRVWLRSIIDKPPPGKPPLLIQESIWFKCDTMDSAMLSVAMYIGTNDKGEQLDSKSWPFSADRFSPIKPGSDREKIAQYLCAKPLQSF